MVTIQAMVLLCLLPFITIVVLSSATPILPSEQAGQCDAGYSFYSGKCYKFTKIQTTYNDAVAACAAENANLPIIRTEDQNNYLARLSATNVGEPLCPFLGLNCTHGYYGCTWNDGTPVGYSNFDHNALYGPESLPVVLLSCNPAYLNQWYPVPAGFDNAKGGLLCEKDPISSARLTLRKKEITSEKKIVSGVDLSNNST